MRDTKIKLGYHSALMVLDWLKSVQVHNQTEPNGFARLNLIVMMRVVEKLHKKTLVAGDVKFKLSAAEALSLQLTLCCYQWPDGIEEVALRTVQQQLPTLSSLENENLSPPKN